MNDDCAVGQTRDRLPRSDALALWGKNGTQMASSHHFLNDSSPFKEKQTCFSDPLSNTAFYRKHPHPIFA